PLHGDPRSRQDHRRGCRKRPDTAGHTGHQGSDLRL
ncbi:uncharacterized protein METZ01_LOCUS203764, partial [marine metagenome]